MDWSKALVVTTISAMLIAAVKDILGKKNKVERLESKISDLEKQAQKVDEDDLTKELNNLESKVLLDTATEAECLRYSLLREKFMGSLGAEADQKYKELLKKLSTKSK